MELNPGKKLVSSISECNQALEEPPSQPALEQSLDANAEWIKHARDEDTREEASYGLTDCSTSLVISGPSRKGAGDLKGRESSKYRHIAGANSCPGTPTCFDGNRSVSSR